MTKYCRVCGGRIEKWEESIDSMHDECHTGIQTKIERQLIREGNGRHISIIVDTRGGEGDGAKHTR